MLLPHWGAAPSCLASLEARRLQGYPRGLALSHTAPLSLPSAHGGNLDAALQAWSSGEPEAVTLKGTAGWPMSSAPSEPRPAGFPPIALYLPAPRMSSLPRAHRTPPPPAPLLSPTFSLMKGLVLPHLLLPGSLLLGGPSALSLLFPRLSPSLVHRLQGDQPATSSHHWQDPRSSYPEAAGPGLCLEELTAALPPPPGPLLSCTLKPALYSGHTSGCGSPSGQAQASFPAPHQLAGPLRSDREGAGGAEACPPARGRGDRPPAGTGICEPPLKTREQNASISKPQIKTVQAGKISERHTTVSYLMTPWQLSSLIINK